MLHVGVETPALRIAPLAILIGVAVGGCSKPPTPDAASSSGAVAMLAGPPSSSSAGPPAWETAAEHGVDASVTPEPPTASGTMSGGETATAAPAKVYDENTRTIEATIGERFTVRLPANVTTPYRWEAMEQKQDAPVILAHREYEDEPPPKCQSCVGYPGADNLVFEARRAGSMTLTLRYLPLRSRDPANRELSIRVTIHPR
jgi:predicted secreted protein